MSITASVWEEAHAYHRQRLRMHSLFSHGPGIVTGLEVIASDPPDSTVYILPGIAVDPLGRTIVLAEPVGYDFGADSQGLLYLNLSYGESEHSADGTEGQQEGEPIYVYTQFVIQAQPTLPDAPSIELARVRRRGKGAPLLDAADPAHPGPNEIDQRFRQEIEATPQETAALAVSYVGGGLDIRHGRGADHLARAISHSGKLRVWVDDDVPLAPGLEVYSLVYLVGHEAFELSVEEMDALYAYHQAGGTVLIESCRQETDSGNPPSDESFSDLLSTLGLQLAELEPDHSLLSEPFFFPAPPPGFETQGTPGVLAGDGVIFSTHDYGCLWQGERRGQSPSREEIRSAMEWGHNILAYAVERHRGTTEPEG